MTTKKINEFCRNCNKETTHLLVEEYNSYYTHSEEYECENKNCNHRGVIIYS